MEATDTHEPTNRHYLVTLSHAAYADSAEQPSDSLPKGRRGFSHCPGFQWTLHGAGYQDGPSLR